MMPRDLLVAALGPAGAALAGLPEAVVRSAVLPRAVLAWLRAGGGSLRIGSTTADLKKSDAGWSGTVSGPLGDVEVSGSEVDAVAAVLAVAGLPSGGPPPPEVARLGTTLDAVAARWRAPDVIEVPEVVPTAERATTAKPRSQAGLRKAVLTPEEAQRPCPACGRPQVSAGTLTGCCCWSGLLQTAMIRKTASGFEVGFRGESAEDMTIFLGTVKRGSIR